MLGHRFQRVVRQANRILKPLNSVAILVDQLPTDLKLRNLTTFGIRALTVLGGQCVEDPYWSAPWQRVPLPATFHTALQELFQQYGAELIPSDGGYFYERCTVSGVPLVLRSGDAWERLSYSSAQHSLEDALAGLGRAYWETYGSNIQMSTVLGAKQEPQHVLTRWVGEKALPSARAATLAARLNAFMRAGKPRGVLFYGQPGTGKSCLMQQLAHHLTGATLYCQIAACDPDPLADITAAAVMLRPTNLLIDDFDRHGVFTRSLTQLEALRQYTQTLLVSVNNYEEMDAAVTRPGRFDEVVHIDQLDAEVFAGLTVTLPPAVRTQIRTWPAAHLHELRERLAVLGPEHLVAEVADLQKRVEDNTRRQKKKADAPDG